MRIFRSSVAKLEPHLEPPFQGGREEREHDQPKAEDEDRTLPQPPRAQLGRRACSTRGGCKGRSPSGTAVFPASPGRSRPAG